MQNDKEIAVPAATIIIPVYNCKAWLKDCLDSICAQTVKDFEVILVDDGSTDGSGDICDLYRKNDPRVQVIHTDNQGVSCARNTGMKAAKGKYLYFVDGDDTVSECLLKKTIPVMEENNLDYLYFDYACCAPEGEEPFWYQQIRTVETTEITTDERIKLLHGLLNYDMTFSACNKVYRRDLVMQNEIIFDEGVKIGEDLGFNLKYLLYANRIKGISDQLYQYWKHPASAMTGGMGDEIRLNDFSLMAEKLEHLYTKARLPKRQFTGVFLKLMNNQLCKRKSRTEYKESIGKVKNIGYLRKKLLFMVLQPLAFRKYFPNENWKGKWKDYLYLLRYSMPI